MNTHIRCPSCSYTESGPINPSEDLYRAKARLRAELGEKCPRQHTTTQVRCPMREHVKTQVR